MTRDEFSKLYTYLEKRLGEIEKKLDDKASKADVDKLASAIDSYAKQAEMFMSELVALSHKVDRLERWITQIADKTGVKLKY